MGGAETVVRGVRGRGGVARGLGDGVWKRVAAEGGVSVGASEREDDAGVRDEGVREIRSEESRVGERGVVGSSDEKGPARRETDGGGRVASGERDARVDGYFACAQ